VKRILTILAVAVLALAPAFAEAHNGHGGGSSHGGGDGGHGGGNGGHGGGEGGHGGDGGHGGGSNGGGSSSGGSSSTSAAPSASPVDGSGLIVIGGTGISQAERDELVSAVKACEAERPGLALGDTQANGSWSSRTADDTVWPYIYRCMAARGFQPSGPDYSQQTNFGSR